MMTLKFKKYKFEIDRKVLSDKIDKCMVLYHDKALENDFLFRHRTIPDEYNKCIKRAYYIYYHEKENYDTKLQDYLTYCLAMLYALDNINMEMIQKDRFELELRYIPGDK
ncbi:MAG: hypothetical protein J6Y28_08650 [Acholeplasmatales bacterium]|nr:hypothetical protein [Acholeplasmatales bacterium]